MRLKDIYNRMDNLKAEKVCIGYSNLNYPIYAFFVGNKEGKLMLCEGSIHAREYISTFLLINLIEIYQKKQLSFGIWFVPLVNPDGVGLCLEGLSLKGINEGKKAQLLKINKNSKIFSLWKANINGVDLNVNFDALWGCGKYNLKTASSANYIGEKPNSEIETEALITFTQKVNPHFTLSFHSKGEVIYWGFETLNKTELKRDKKIANKLAKTNGYKPVKTKQSTGGYSDFISLHYHVPAFTIELGADYLTHPIKLKYLKKITKQNENIILKAGEFFD